MYSEQEIEGKGIGCVANESIAKGTLILREAPALRMQVPGDGWTYHQTKLLMQGYIQMTEEDRAEYMKLSDAFSEDKECFSKKANGQLNYMNRISKLHEEGLREEEDTDIIWKVWKIFESNAFNYGVYLKMSRFNHACRPNADYYWNTDVQKRDIRARRNIKKGEEITLSYLDSGYITKKERQEHLKEEFNFECNCECCNKTEEETKNEIILCGEYRKIAKEREDLKAQSSGNLLIGATRPMTTLSNIRGEIECLLKMYRIAKEMKLLKNQFILKYIVEECFDAACQGYLLCKDIKKKNLHSLSRADLVNFIKVANNLANVGEEIAVITYGEDHSISRQWKERKSNPMQFFIKEWNQSNCN